MKKLVQGIVDFRKRLRDEDRAIFAKLALEQSPDALFIACSDSRVVPNLFASTNPGDLFVVRNVGNLIPPISATHTSSVLAAIEFALFSLNIQDIIVCGHSECGAIKAIAQGVEHSHCPHLTHWLRYGSESLKQFQNGRTIDPSLSKHNQISQLNVLHQLEHLSSHPCVHTRLQAGILRIHGWWFDIAHADVYCYEKARDKFVLIDEHEANIILNKLK